MLYSAGDKIKLDYFLQQVSNVKERDKELQNILEVMSYAESRSCRWITLIKYFGEKPNIDSCGTCDVCQAGNDTVDSTEITQKILSGILKTGEKFGKAHVLKVLRGSREQKVLDYGHDTLSVWGIAKEHKEAELGETFMQLIAHGLIGKNVGEYPTFCVTQKGRQFLTKKETIQLPRIVETMLADTTDSDPTTSSASQSRVKKKRKARSGQVVETDEKCFAELRALRRKIADERGVPAFVIFGDASLHAMSYQKPQTLEEFATITGVGEKKLVEFGEIFIEGDSGVHRQARVM